MFTRLQRNLRRRKKPVTFGDLGYIKPISSTFGLDRGRPIDRYYIEKFLETNARFISGQVLEVADSHYSKKFGSSVESYGVLHSSPGNSKTTIVGDLTDTSTLPENEIDCFICTQTLNFIFDVHKAIEGTYHVLKPGGVLLATVAGLSQISRYDMDRWGDYWRFTTASVRRLFAAVYGENIEINSCGNVITAIALLQGLAVEDIPDPKVLDEHDPDYQVVITIIARKVL